MMRWTLQAAPIRRALGSWEDIVVVHQVSKLRFATLRITGTVAQHQHSLAKHKTLQEALRHADTLTPNGGWVWTSLMTAVRGPYRFQIASDRDFYVVTVLETLGDDVLVAHAHSVSDPFESWQDAVAWAEGWSAEGKTEPCSCGT